MNDEPADTDLFITDEPLPYWRGSPWACAYDSLFYGDTKRMAELLDQGELIPIEVAKVLARALRGGKGLPFRLQLIANPKLGGKRPGRWPERNGIRDLTLAAQMYKRMQKGNHKKSYDAAAQAVADEANKAGLCISEKTVKVAYSKCKDIAPIWLAGLSSSKSERKRWEEELAKRDTALPQPPIAAWMLGGDKEGCK